MSSWQHTLWAVIWLSVLGWGMFFSEPVTEAPAEQAPGDDFFEADVDPFDDDPFAEAPSATQPRLESVDGSYVVIREGVVKGRYAPGDVLHSGAELVAILDRAVLLNRHGVYQLLCCISERGAAVPTAGLPRLIDLRSSPDATRIARSYHSKLYINPLSLIGKVQIEAGANAGSYRVYPGSDKRAFETFGLQPGDQVLGVNGIALAEKRAVPALFQNLASASHIAVTLNRAGETLVVLLSLESSV